MGTKALAPIRGDKRRAEVLRVALALFNKRGTPAVSTNHIAAELGISVGNLYWHFRDKEAITRTLFEEHHRKFDGVWKPPAKREEAAAVAVQAVRRSFAIAWEYRFIYRELASLARADAELRKLHAAARDQRRAELRAFIGAFGVLGALRLPRAEEALIELEDLSWLVASFWLPHAELRDGALTKRSALQGARALLGLYLPYATNEYAGELLRALDDVEEDTTDTRQ